MSKQLALKNPFTYLNVVPVSIQKKVMEESIFIQAKPEVVWHLMTNPDTLPLWDKSVQDVSLNHWLSEGEADVTGTYRILYGVDGTIQKQVITDWQPQKTLGYKTVEGLQFHQLSVSLHIGLFKLYPSSDGTEVQWLNYLEYQDLPHSHTWLSRLMRRYHRSLACLKWCAENIHSENKTLA
jgi:hypothetical protein